MAVCVQTLCDSCAEPIHLRLGAFSAGAELTDLKCRRFIASLTRFLCSSKGRVLGAELATLGGEGGNKTNGALRPLFVVVVRAGQRRNCRSYRPRLGFGDKFSALIWIGVNYYAAQIVVRAG